MKKKRAVKKAMKKVEGKRANVVFLLDETGSMNACREATISGFNEYIGSLKKKSENSRLTLVTFDSEHYNTRFKEAIIKNIPELNQDTYKPGACTPLYDSLARIIKEASGKSLCIVMTDGLENASKEHTKESILKLIKAKEKEGWTFVYLGANQDAWAVGATIGMQTGNTFTYDAKKTKAAMRGLAVATSAYCSSGGIQTDTLLTDNSFSRIYKEEEDDQADSGVGSQ